MSEGAGGADPPPALPDDQRGSPPDGPAGQKGSRDTPEVVAAEELTVSEVADSTPRQGRSYDIEDTRAGLAIAFVAIFASTIAAAILIVALTGDNPAKEVLALLPTLIPAETALLGSAVGFYFGTKPR